MNARAPLRIIGVGNCWEHVHPDVIYVPEGFAGFSYWIVFTSYPLANDLLENPIIRASHDGMTWQSVTGITDPVVAPPDSCEIHHADPELIYKSGYLHLVYASIHRRTDEATFNCMKCKSDLHWSEPVVIQRDIGAVSPTFQIDGEVFHEWFIRMNMNDFNHSELFHRDGSDLTSLGHERKCHLDIPGYVAWHVDVLKVDGTYEALIAAYPRGTDESRTRLFHLTSKDGLSFELESNKPLIEPSSLGWDNRMIYRSTFLKSKGGTYRVWYSAASWGCHFGIGLLQGTLDSLEEPTTVSAPVPSYVRRLPGEVEGWLRYEARHRLPARLLSLAPTAFFRNRTRRYTLPHGL